MPLSSYFSGPLFLLCHFVQDLVVCADLSRQGKSLIIGVFFGVSSLPTCCSLCKKEDGLCLFVSQPCMCRDYLDSANCFDTTDENITSDTYCARQLNCQAFQQDVTQNGVLIKLRLSHMSFIFLTFVSVCFDFPLLTSASN